MTGMLRSTSLYGRPVFVRQCCGLPVLVLRCWTGAACQETIIYKKRVEVHTGLDRQKNAWWYSRHDGSIIKKIKERVHVWTPREAQEVSVHHSRHGNARLKDAVAIVTHQVLESRAKSALISITSFSGRYCVRCFYCLILQHFRVQCSKWHLRGRSAASFLRHRRFSQSRHVGLVIIGAPADLPVLDLWNEGISCWVSHFSWLVPPMTNTRGGCTCGFKKCYSLCDINFCSLLWNAGRSAVTLMKDRSLVRLSSA